VRGWRYGKFSYLALLDYAVLKVQKMIKTIRFLMLFSIIPIIGFPQENDIFFDNETNIAYSKVDSSLFTGAYFETFRNGQKKFLCEYKKGIIQLMKRWNKKGVLIDSTIYLDGDKRQKHFRFYKTGEIKEVGTTYLIDDKVLGMDLYENEGTHTFYYKNGKKKSEIDYYKGQNKEFISVYYENGNLMSSGLFISNPKNTKGIGILLQDSVHNEYRENGTLKTKTTYSNGKQDGPTIYYKEDGTIERKEEYEEGIKIQK
jgi:antitoxin component YwqK of YwqJK toxin-antitoxin module